MDDGAISTPIKTQFGWHVIKLNATRSMNTPEMEDVREELEQEVRMQVVDRYISELIGSATISRTPAADIDVSQLKDISLLEK